MEPSSSLFLLAAAASVVRTLFSAAEVAFARASKRQVRERYLHGKRRAVRVLFALSNDPEGAFAAARAASMASLAVAAALGGAAVVVAFGVGEPWAAALLLLCGGLGVALFCFLLEIVPRSLASADPERWALRLAPLLGLAFLFTAGPARLISRIGGKLLAPLGAKVSFRLPAPGMEELEHILSEANGGGEDNPTPHLLQSIFELPTMTVREAMIPRTEVVALSLDDDSDEIVRKVVHTGYACYPVYEGSIDHIVGVLRTKDLLPLLPRAEGIDLRELLQPVAFVPWATRLGKLLRRMHQEKLELALVTDEHGGFLGIVTREDILSELFGSFGVPREPAEIILQQADGSHLVEAGIPIDDFNEHFLSTLPEDGGYGTLAGYLNHLAGAIPEVGQILESDGLLFTVVDRSPRRVLRVRVTRAAEPVVGAA